MSYSMQTLPESVGYIAKVVQTLREMDGVAEAGAVREAIVAAMVAAKEPINETIQSGAPKYQNDIRWARMYLVNAGMLVRSEVSGRGTWKLTPAGWSTPLDERAVVAIYFKSEGKNGAPPTESKVVPSDDGLQKDLPGLNSWESQFKKLLTKMPDKGFERLCAEKEGWLTIHVANRGSEVRVYDKLVQADGKEIHSVVAFEIDRWGELRSPNGKLNAVMNACFGSYGPIWRLP